MSSPISVLNQQQQLAVKHLGSPLLVLAGAGSGKTSVITQKIAWLVRENGMPAASITAVTFTNKAAREMRGRVQALLPNSQRAPQIGTFHQLGLKIIQQHTDEAGRKAGFSILDEQDAASILKDILLRANSDDDAALRMLQNQISQWKGQCTLPSSLQGTASSKQEERWIQAYERYQQAMQSYNALDFDDLLLIPVALLRRNKTILDRWQQRVRYLLVDEYQDTNVAQYELMKLLVGERNCLCVVGDDDQSIYTWRGANPENLQQLSADFKDLRVIKLEQNYRSTNSILTCANQLISHNEHLFEKKLWSKKGTGAAIKVERLATEDDEAEHICNSILASRLKYHSRFKDYAVLVRSGFQAKLLELKLQAQQVPYHLTGGTSFFAKNEIKDLLAYLRLLVNPEDDSAFLRIINTPRRKIGVQTIEQLGQYAQTRNVGLYHCIDELGLTQSLSTTALDKLQRFSHWLSNKKTLLEKNHDIRSVLDEIVTDIDYEGWLAQNSSSTAVAEKRMENVRFLFESIEKEAQRIRSEQELNNDEVLEQVINKLLLRDLLDQQAEEDADNKVQIMTLHAAKGLEFDHVIIMGFEENILPHRNSIDSGDVSEERRLAYVGITRAQKTLTLTLAKTRKQFGEKIHCEPSRFIEELPQEFLQQSGMGDESSKVNNEAQGQETLANLRALFD